MLTERTIVNRLEKLANRVTANMALAGYYWYSTAHRWCRGVSTATGTHIEVVAGVLAVLSPSVSWEGNKSQAENLIIAFNATGEVDGVVLTTYKNQIKKALSILDDPKRFHTFGQSIEQTQIMIGARAFKTFAFYHNITYPESSRYVTIDRHIFDVLKIEQKAGNRGQYQTISTAFRIVADRYDILPHQLQARIWLQHKHDKDDTAKAKAVVECPI